METFVDKIFRLPRYPVLWVLYAYQKLLSPDHSFWAKRAFPYGYCKFSPSCSQYAVEIITKRGLLIGIPKSVWRIMRCNPWTEGGEDLPK